MGALESLTVGITSQCVCVCVCVCVCAGCLGGSVSQASDSISAQVMMSRWWDRALCWAWGLLGILSLPPPLTHMLSLSQDKHFLKKTKNLWLSWLSIWLRLRSWSQGSWVQAPCRALCWQLTARSLLQILCLLLSLCPSPAHTLSLSLSLSKINKCKKKILKGILVLMELFYIWL